MSIDAVIRSEFEQVAREQGRPLAHAGDDLVLLDSGLDSLCMAIILSRLEDQLGIDPFAAADEIALPATLGDFIRLYRGAA